MENLDNKTITAISTPIGVGGIAIIRLSGNKSVEIADRVFSCKTTVKNFEPRKLYLGTVNALEFKDKCLCVYFKSPFSYTGEDLVEFQIHGGVALAEGVLSALIANGASLSSPGEFTQRAFLNGKISLESAEGIMDMINAESNEQIKAGFNLLNGELNKKVNEFQNTLTDIIAKIEVALDYPEHDIEYITEKEVLSQINSVNSGLGELVNSYKTGKIIKDGINIAIIGSPNVGKSSLMNALLNYERAIVTSIAGTTRDTLEESYIFNGIKVNIIDTAGIRKSDDEIERIGIERSFNACKEADLVLYVLDNSIPVDTDEINRIKSITNKIIIVKNKSDLCANQKNCESGEYLTIEVSAKNKTKINELKELIYNTVLKENVKSSSIIITNRRHMNILSQTIEFLRNSINSINNGLSLDIIILDIQLAWNKLGEITGKSYTQEVLNTIFSKFCLGK